MCYGWEGLKKMFCCCFSPTTRRVKDVLDYVAVLDEATGQEKVIFAANAKSASRPAEHYLRGDPVSFVCTNINSMMGGQTNMWESGRGREMGLVNKEGRSLPKTSFNNFKD